MVPLERDEVLEARDAVEFGGVDEAHEHVADARAGERLVEPRRSCDAESPSSEPARRRCCPGARRARAPAMNELGNRTTDLRIGTVIAETVA